MEKAIQLADDLEIQANQLVEYDIYYKESFLEIKRFLLEDFKAAATIEAVRGEVFWALKPLLVR